MELNLSGIKLTQNDRYYTLVFDFGDQQASIHIDKGASNVRVLSQLRYLAEYLPGIFDGEAK